MMAPTDVGIQADGVVAACTEEYGSITSSVQSTLCWKMVAGFKVSGGIQFEVLSSKCGGA